MSSHRADPREASSRLSQRLVYLHKRRDDLDVEIQVTEEALSRALRAQEKAKRNGAGMRRRSYHHVAKCGTPSGYYRHRRTLKEPACEACLIAHRVAEAVRVQKRREEGKA